MRNGRLTWREHRAVESQSCSVYGLGMCLSLFYPSAKVGGWQKRSEAPNPDSATLNWFKEYSRFLIEVSADFRATKKGFGFDSKLVGLEVKFRRAKTSRMRGLHSKLVRLEGGKDGKNLTWYQQFAFQTGSIRSGAIHGNMCLWRISFHSTLVRLEVRGSRPLRIHHHVSIPNWSD